MTAALMVSACGQTGGTAIDQSALSGAALLEAAAANDQHEIDSARVLLRRSRNAEIRTFATKLMAEHRLSAAELKPAGAGAALPIDLAVKRKAVHAGDLNMLEMADPSDLDEVYVSQRILAHQEALAMARAYATGGDDPAVKDWARRNAASVDRHLQQALILAYRKSSSG